MKLFAGTFAFIALLLAAVANPSALVSAPGGAADWTVPLDGHDQTSAPVAAPPLAADDDDGKYVLRAPDGRRAADAARSHWWPRQRTTPDPAYLIPLKTGPPAA